MKSSEGVVEIEGFIPSTMEELKKHYHKHLWDCLGQIKLQVPEEDREAILEQFYPYFLKTGLLTDSIKKFYESYERYLYVWLYRYVSNYVIEGEFIPATIEELEKHYLIPAFLGMAIFSL